MGIISTRVNRKTKLPLFILLICSWSYCAHRDSSVHTILIQNKNKIVLAIFCQVIITYLYASEITSPRLDNQLIHQMTLFRNHFKHLELAMWFMMSSYFYVILFYFSLYIIIQSFIFHFLFHSIFFFNI